MIPVQIVVIAGSAVQSGKLNDIPRNIEHEPFVVVAADELKSGPGSAKGISYQNEKACLVTMINFGSSKFYISSNKEGNRRSENRSQREPQIQKYSEYLNKMERGSRGRCLLSWQEEGRCYLCGYHVHHHSSSNTLSVVPIVDCNSKRLHTLKQRRSKNSLFPG
jgi:hypothetical protein